MKNLHGRPLTLGLVSLSLTSLAGVLSGCAPSGSPSVADASHSTSNTASMDWEMQWAQAALERNPNLEVVSDDRELRVYLVRDRHTAQSAEVQLAQIAAAPIAFLAAPQSEPNTPTARPKPEASAPEEQVITRLADNSTEPDAPAPVATPKSHDYTIDRSDGRTRVTGDGISVVYGDSPVTRHTAVSSAPTSPYNIDRSSGLVRISGPGVSIEASEEPGANRRDELADAEIEPVICEGPRVMQLDSRTINVDGDALTARGGCELFITNSTIVASGTGVVIGDATVHINNSRIAGGLASFEAKERAKVFLRGSTLDGVPRRAGEALIQDQGGNSFR